MNQLDTMPVRNVKFALDESVPEAWYGGRPAVSLYFDNLSTLFPLGERFFMQSVRHYQDRIEDEALLAEIKAFHAQEAVHSREHEGYNRMLRARGIDVDQLEVGIGRLLWLPHLFGPLQHRVRLLVTMSLEHWTAMLGHLTLCDDDLLAPADPTMAALWRWHSAEEIEHKGVAMDVYRAIGGGYAMRAVFMLITTAFFWARVAHQQVKVMRWAGLAWQPSAWADLGRFFWVEQRVPQRILPLWAAWFRPSFHPWQVDDRALLARWRAEWMPQLP